MNEIASAVKNIIETYLGIMAHPIIKNNCRRQGIDSDKMTKEDFKNLLPQIKKQINIFTNKEKATEINRKLEELYKKL